MKYKLVAVDMDGTLLNSKGIITPDTISAIKRVVDMGIIFTISTGRPIMGVNKYNDILKLDVPFITYNGGMIVNSITKDVLYEQGLSETDAKDILREGNKLDTTIIVWSCNKLYVNKINERSNEYSRMSGLSPILIEDEDLVIKNGITKILWYDDIDKINEYQVYLKDKLSDGVSYCTSKPIFLEFTDIKVSKANALKRLGDYLNIEASEMIAIGDGFNDLSMLEYVGLGVAMDNAPKGVKSVCKYITKSNDEDGVAEVLNKYFK